MFPLVFAAAIAVVALGIVAFVALLEVPEIEHRTDSSWHYERITLTVCSALLQERYQGITYSCTFATVPPLPFAIDPSLDVTATGRGGAPGSTTEWVHVVDGRITGVDGTKAPLWVLAFLIIPVLMLGGFVRWVRAAHRAGRRWRDPRGT